MELFPIAGGFVFFLACFLVGTTQMASPAPDKSRWAGFGVIAIGLFGLWPLLSLMPPPHPTLDSLSGTYVGDYAGGTETYLLSPDGKYSQRFVRGGNTLYNNHGRWQVENDGVSFENVLLPFDGHGQQIQPMRFAFCGTVLHWLDGAIYFNEDDDIYIHRVSR